MKTTIALTAAAAALMLSLTPAVAQSSGRSYGRQASSSRQESAPGRTDRYNGYGRTADRNGRNDSYGRTPDRSGRDNGYGRTTYRSGRTDRYGKTMDRNGRNDSYGVVNPAAPLLPVMNDITWPVLEEADYRFAHSCGDYAEHFYNHPVKSEPLGAKSLTAGGVTYLVSHDIYFRNIGGRLCISRPPYGEVLDRSFFITEPRPCKMNPAFRSNKEYFCGDGVVFQLGRRDTYTVVEPPVGLWIDELPDDAGTAVIDGVKYYVIDGTLFKNVPGTRRPTFEAVGRL